MNLRVLIVFATVFIECVFGYNFLFLGIFNAKSHVLYMQSFIKAVLDRGHQVTFVTSQSIKYLNLTNYTEVLIDPPFELYSLIPHEKLLTMGSTSPFLSLTEMIGTMQVVNEHALQNSNVQKLIHSTDLHFDVVINEDFFAENLLMFAHKFKAPIITICPYGISFFNDEQMGLLSPLSITPNWLLPYTDNMTFYERWYNTMLSICDWLVRRLFHIPGENALAKKYFSHLEPLPSIDDLMHSVSVVLVNTHRALSPARATMPGTISVGGAHIKPTKPLPQDLQKFLDESPNGVIYFSLGTIIQSSKLSEHQKQAFLGAFKRLKQRVLWKFDDESIPDIPSNVVIRKWLPQNDILAHPNVILFISHGGLFGTSESLYHGVPLLVIPIFGDQFRNAHRIEQSGYGKYLILEGITTESLLKTITEIISNERFITKAKHTSAVFKDNLVHPIDEAMFWIEHVARFKGAKHLKSHAVHMSWFTYLSLDVILVTVIAGIVFIFVLYKLIKMLVSKKNTPISTDKKRK